MINSIEQRVFNELAAMNTIEKERRLRSYFSTNSHRIVDNEIEGMIGVHIPVENAERLIEEIRAVHNRKQEIIQWTRSMVSPEDPDLTLPWRQVESRIVDFCRLPENHASNDTFFYDEMERVINNADLLDDIRHAVSGRPRMRIQETPIPAQYITFTTFAEYLPGQTFVYQAEDGTRHNASVTQVNARGAITGERVFEVHARISTEGPVATYGMAWTLDALQGSAPSRFDLIPMADNVDADGNFAPLSGVVTTRRPEDGYEIVEFRMSREYAISLNVGDRISLSEIMGSSQQGIIRSIHPNPVDDTATIIAGIIPAQEAGRYAGVTNALVSLVRNGANRTPFRGNRTTGRSSMQGSPQNVPRGVAVPCLGQVRFNEERGYMEVYIGDSNIPHIRMNGGWIRMQHENGQAIKSVDDTAFEVRNPQTIKWQKLAGKYILGKVIQTDVEDGLYDKIIGDIYFLKVQLRKYRNAAGTFSEVIEIEPVFNDHEKDGLLVKYFEITEIEFMREVTAEEIEKERKFRSRKRKLDLED